MQLQLNQLDLRPGQRVLLRNISWDEFEPDACFYIQNEAVVRGRERIDLNTPPPDLAIEVDVTTDSQTKKNIYQSLGVPELWIYDKRDQQLQINVLTEGKYIESDQSKIFPDLPIVDVIPQYLALSKAEGRNAAIKAFRAWLASESKH